MTVTPAATTTVADGEAPASAPLADALLTLRENVPAGTATENAPDAFVVASFALRPTFVTKLRTALWRAPDVAISVHFDDGSEAGYKAVAATLPDGVVVSALPHDTAEAARLFAREPVRAVRDVTIHAAPGAYVLDGVTFTRERRR